jgi:uncharacterized protein (DUF1778 family)
MPRAENQPNYRRRSGKVGVMLSVPPADHRLLKAAAGLAGKSMATFALDAAVSAADAALRAAGVDPARLVSGKGG